ncbi:TetR/AcrR family transcriptional regulator [Mumia sp. zg.B53]|uniref:TetR/AcrR family transcriptional regulator n=1 Tax=unclassified Mumia TaxID=2621872 RepID=UPI001C6E584F|nr:MULTISPECIES: TetR/AcrR family transcriptional regulator [unclassified Mumia]MBW9209569.1 TetR/AcrR family transcriptional regulator [Mumia sp. zg.B21]MBW9214174.1 TetR/AcrR family transcriptional regulator [Mumia sp. zg.B53]MDD9348332.1 TetR/AcrR family transcriptional regulator [Mumia sp.]
MPTRAERQAQTREALVGTARSLFLHDGFAATSLDRVAVEAGFSKGAVYSNFKSKEELGLAVLDEIHREMVAEVVEALSIATAYEDALHALEGWLKVRLGQPRWTALEVEFAAVVRTSPFVATELATRHRQIRASIASLLVELQHRTGMRLALPADQVALVLLSLGIGLGAQRSLDPGLDVHAFTATIRSLLLPPDAD